MKSDNMKQGIQQAPARSLLNALGYTAEEIAADPSLKDYKLGEKDIVFDINYDLKIVDGYENIMAFTAASGEIKDNWVVNKSNVGIAKYGSDGKYTVQNFGTGF